MRKVAIIGVGGVNSWAIKYLKELADDYEQKDLIYVKLFDDDKVEEKNLLRANQNFVISDLMQYKAKVLGERLGYDYSNIQINEDNINTELQMFDDIIVGVDNNKTRMLLYKYCIDNKKYLIDLRAQATQMMFVVVDGSKNFDYYKEKYFTNKELNERKGSCQLNSDITNDHLENGNKIIACLGILGVYFKHLRKEQVTTNEYKFVY